MTCQISAICFDAVSPSTLAGFWAGLLVRRIAEEAGGALLPGDDTQVGLRFLTGSPRWKGEHRRLHLHLTSEGPTGQQETVAAALRLGARHLDVGQRPDEGHIVLADPEDNEFCVIEAGNNFLAGCGLLGEVSCDGTRAVGHFWSAALGWPLVWDQDEETAVQSPSGGTKVSWGGPPLTPKTHPNQQRYDLTPTVPGGHRSEIDRLVSLGATVLTPGEHGTTVLADPDGNEFRLLTP
ncbi:MAG TPA: VOC family protein [Actinoplanes sp.]|nr:VOC family protein [Actinoplanes sp.]